MRMFATFEEAANRLKEEFRYRAYSVKSEKWQGVSTAAKPEMEMRELLNWSFGVPLRGIEDLAYWQGDIKPNLPFADAHFAERVSGNPTNPGEAWKIWPWGNSADAHRTQQGKFTHTYQERFWPKHAGHVVDCDPDPNDLESYCSESNRGYRYDYGDVRDVVTLLSREPLTRQAYLPIWFPEDTGVLHGGRVPCSLGYHFIQRNGYLHINYFIRSCDFVRHFRDDCYFTVRLALWVLEELRKLNDIPWREVKPGLFSMHTISMHMFINDYRKLFPEQPHAL
jgi:hypothetical protein